VGNWLLQSRRLLSGCPKLHVGDSGEEWVQVRYCGYAGFEWIDLYDADNSILTFLREARSRSTVLFALNATPVPRHAYRIEAPGEGWYEEILNTDGEFYGGGNIGGVQRYLGASVR
jgi:1,4-alpha-glucan branching enzyme